jgi:predicted nucleic acid-binding protein
MRLPNSPPDPGAALVADTSFWINLASTVCPGEILQALSGPVIVPDVALEELRRGQATGRQSAQVVEALLASGHARVETLPPAALATYIALVAGPAAETLDDGEAATLALAHAVGGRAIIDEKKARRLSPVRFPGLRLLYTIELLLLPAVEGILGRTRVSDAIFAALNVSRMRVPAELIGSVIEIIGHERARLCHSLPIRSRMLMEIGTRCSPTAETGLCGGSALK